MREFVRVWVSFSAARTVGCREGRALGWRRGLGCCSRPVGLDEVCVGLLLFSFFSIFFGLCYCFLFYFSRFFFYSFDFVCVCVLCWEGFFVWIRGGGVVCFIFYIICVWFLLYIFFFFYRNKNKEARSVCPSSPLPSI